MSDNMDKAIDRALRVIVNEPVEPCETLMKGLRTKAEAASKARRRTALFAAGTAMVLNAALAATLAITVILNSSGGWVAVAAGLMGMTLAVLPVVPLLAIEDIPELMFHKLGNRLERS